MKYVVGIDEVGRGPLAGPLTICVVSCEENLYKKLKKNRDLPNVGLDSKKLSSQARQKYAKFFTSLSRLNLDNFSFSIIHISNKLIDSKGLSFCIKKLIANGLQKLKINPKNSKILLDGSLYAPKEFKNQKTIIKGDEKEKIIAWASILAKVSRDKLMTQQAKKFPNYGFELHKGYGTLYHRKAIKTYGFSIIHRLSFCGQLARRHP